MQEEEEERELLLKIVVVGDDKVGKTSFIKRYVYDLFNPQYKATVSSYIQIILPTLLLSPPLDFSWVIF
jgi:GTPase SAR1 family protein